MAARLHFTFIFLVTLITLSAPALTQAAQNTGRTIKCWKNDLGIRECGSIVPPEYSQKRIEVINERGIVVQVIEPPKTREQLQKEREQEEKRKAIEDAKKEQLRQDSILLNSYATERDLLIARDTSMKAINSQLDIANGNLKMLRSNLDNLQTRAGNYERSGKKPPQRLIQDIKSTSAMIARKDAIIEKRQEDKKAMEEHFERQLARYRKLKGIKPEPNTQPASSTAGPKTPAAKH